MTRVLVTGGAGAVGTNLVTALHALGARVCVLDDLSSGRADGLPAGVDMVHGSVEDEALLRDVFARGFDDVLHLAALFANQNSVDNPQRDLSVNGMGTLRVLELAHRSGVRKVLYCSSSCVYGSAGGMREEEALSPPETPYAITKHLGEQYAGFFARHHNLDTVIVRLFNVYGPHEYPGIYRNVIPNFLHLARRGEPLPITGTGEETRDFTYVEDAVRGILAALRTRTTRGEAFNIASGRETRIMDLAQQINALTGNSAGVRFVDRRSWDNTRRRMGRIDKARRILGYEPQVDLETGLRQTAAWFEQING